MNVVTHTRTVRSIVVVTKDSEFLTLTNGSLCDVRHQIVGNAVGIFTYSSRLVSPDGIKITEQYYIPFRISLLHIRHHLLQHRLRLTVRIGALPLGTIFSDRDYHRVSIYCRRTGEDDVLATILTHHIHQDERASHVVVIILQRLCHRLAYSLQTRKMYHGIYTIFSEYPFHGIGITDVSLIKKNFLAYDFLNAVNCLGLRISKIVNYDDRMTCLVQFDDGVSCNISSSTAK